MRKIFVGIILIAACFSCSRQHYVVTDIQAQRVAVISDKSLPVNKEINDLVSSYKHLLDKEMNQIVGRSAVDMTYSRPESLLTNLTSDVMLEYAKSLLNGDCDLAFMNVNGHRSNLAKGDITVGNVFEIYSFENALVIVKLKGSDLLQAFQSYANMGGAGISSTCKLTIRGKDLVSATVKGKEIDKDKIYTIVTLDYLADGNDGLEVLKNAVSVSETGAILRDVMLKYIQDETRRGNEITARLDGRITIEK